MKKQLMVIVAIVLFQQGAVHAQLLDGYGIQVGTTWSSERWLVLHTDDPGWWGQDYSGISVIGFAEFAHYSVFSGVVEVQYSQETKKFTPIYVNNQGLPYKASFSVRMNLLSIPILAKVRFLTPYVSTFLLAGPRLTLLVGSHDDGELAVSLRSYKKTQYGVTLGIGAQWRYLLAEFRYNPNFTYSYDGPWYSIMSHSFDVLVGVEF